MTPDQPATASTLAQWAADGHLPTAVAAQAIRAGRRDRRDPLIWALEQQLVSRHTTLRLIAEGLGLPFVDLTDLDLRVDVDAAARAGTDVLADACCVPVQRGEDRVVVAAQPRDARSLAAAAAAYPDGYTVAYADPIKIGQRIDSATRTLATRAAPREESSDTPDVARVANRQTMPGWLTDVLETACHLRASDVHLQLERGRAVARLRVDGTPGEPIVLDGDADTLLRQAIQHLGMDVAVTARDQDAALTWAATDGTEVRLRASAAPTAQGAPRLTVRLLEAGNRPPPLDGLGMSPPTTQLLRLLTTKPQRGLIVVSGQSSGGKSTTQHAMLAELAARNHIIWAIEDTLEYVHPEAVSHIPVSDDFSWSQAIRAAMRANADVILVGETRDADTAHAAVSAAKTGAMTMTTLHAPTAIDVFPRLSSLGISGPDAAVVVRLVIHQELLPKLHDCAMTMPLSTADIDVLGQLGVPPPPSGVAARATGCDGCHGTGYAGQVPLVEILLPDADIRDAVGTDGGYAALERAATPGRNWIPASMDASRLLDAGLVTIDDIASATLIDTLPAALPDGLASLSTADGPIELEV